MKLNPALKDFWLKKARVKVLYGGRSSSKTHDAAGMAVWIANKARTKFLCTRQFQNRITESVYTVIKQKIEDFGLSENFTITNNRIVNKVTGSEFVFLGLWRNIDEIKSLEGVDVCWLEEAHNITQEQWDTLEPTVRKEGSQFWIIFNPRLRTDFVYKNFVVNPPKNCVIRKINYTENPFLSQTILDVIEDKKQKDYDEYRHIYLGEPRTDATNSLFDYELIENAMTDEYNPEWEAGAFVYGLDVARFGDDATVLCKRKGLVVTDISLQNGKSTTEVAGYLAFSMREDNPDGVIIDTIGVGAGVFDQLVSQGYDCIEGNAAAKANDDRFLNKRAEMYYGLKSAMKSGLKLPKDDELLEELMSITYEYTPHGKIKITAKDEIKEHLGRSPDRSDAVALTYYTPIASREFEQFEEHHISDTGVDNDCIW